MNFSLLQQCPTKGSLPFLLSELQWPLHRRKWIPTKAKITHTKTKVVPEASLDNPTSDDEEEEDDDEEEEEESDYEE